MRVLPVSIVMKALTAAAGAWATAAPQTAEPPPPRIFDTRTDPHFGDPRPALRAYLKMHGVKPGRAQHFCAVGYDDNGGSSFSKWAEVHWLEGARMIRWSANDPERPADLLTWRKELDLTKDVVATEADINGSTYLVTRAWVDGVLADCAARGTRYTVALSNRRRG